MPRNISIGPLEQNSTYRIYLKGEEYNLPFIDIKTPKIITRTDIFTLPSTVAISGNVENLAGGNFRQLTASGRTASTNTLYAIARISGDGTAKTINRLTFFAPNASISGDWSSYISGKSTNVGIASVSYAGQTDTTASLSFLTDAKLGNVVGTRLDAGASGLWLALQFQSTNANTALDKLTFPITASLTDSSITVSGSTRIVKTFIAGASISGSTGYFEITTNNTNAYRRGVAERAKTLLTGSLTIRIDGDVFDEKNSGKEMKLKIGFSDESRLLLKNTTSIRDFIIPIYRMRFGADATGWTGWFMCPLKKDSTGILSNYDFYTPIIFDDTRYGAATPTSIKTSDLVPLASIPPSTVKLFDGYGTTSSSPNFFQPKLDSTTPTITMDAIIKSNLNAGLPSEYEMIIYSGYPQNICQQVEFGFIVATYTNNNGTWQPFQWTPGSKNGKNQTRIFFSRRIVLDTSKIFNGAYNTEQIGLTSGGGLDELAV